MVSALHFQRLQLCFVQMKKYSILSKFNNKMITSKLSPYRRNAIYQNQAQSSYMGKEQSSRLAEKSRLGKSIVTTAHTPDRKEMDRSYHLKVTQRKRNEVQIQIDTLKEQNKHLLTENNQLLSFVSQRENLIMVLEQKLSQQFTHQARTLQEIEFQKNRFIIQFQKRTLDYDKRIQTLLRQVDSLNEKIFKIEMAKEFQLDNMKVHLAVEHKRQIESLLVSHSRSTEILELQINQLKELIEHKQNQQSQLLYEVKTTKQKHRQQIVSLNEQITHLKYIKKLQMSEKKIEYQNIIHSITCEGRKEQQVSAINYQIELKKIRNELHCKRIEAQKLQSEVEAGKTLSQHKDNQLLNKRTQLESEIFDLERRNKEILFREKQHMRQINEAEISTLSVYHRSELETLQSEIAKLKQLNDTKADEIHNLHNQIVEMRKAKDDEIRAGEILIENLKKKIEEIKQDRQEDDEVFKIKMAQLHHADIESLRSYYDNQIEVLTQDLENRQMAIREGRDKVHRQIQDKSELRKNFLNEVSKLKVKIAELEIKLAQGSSENRQQHASLNSKMELTSMHLIRQTNDKEKLTLFFEQERRKLQGLITSKDQQIRDLQEKIHQLKQDYNRDIQQRDYHIDQANKKCEDLDKSLKSEHLFYENELRKKEGQSRDDKQFYEDQIQKLKNQHAQEYTSIVKEYTIEKTSLENQRNQLWMIIKQLKDQLTTVKENKDQEIMDKDITLEEQKNRLKSQKGFLEISLKNFYETQIQQKDLEIKDLGQQLREKEADIRQMKQQYSKLQNKLSLLLQSQEKLRDIENKVMAIGEDNSAIKCFAQILKTRRRN